MKIRLGLMIAGMLVGHAGSNGAVRAEDATVVFATSFTLAADVNYDDWPDYWRRETGENYPHYTRVAIVDDPTTDDGRSLLVELDGGGAKFRSQAVTISPKFGYRLLLQVKVEHLHYTRLNVVVELQDRQGNVLQVERGEPIGNTQGWVDLAVGPFRPRDGRIERAVIQFDLPRGERGDLQGRVSIDDLALERLPSMTLTTDSENNLYEQPGDIEVTCEVSGIRNANPAVRFELLDASGSVIDQQVTRLQQGNLADDPDSGDTDADRGEGYEGTFHWRPRVDQSGFYMVRVEMIRPQPEAAVSDGGRQLDPQAITFVVLPELPRPTAGEFGWTLPRGDDPLSFDQLIELLPRVGVHWVKLPVWYPPEDSAAGENLVRFAERASAAGIEVVGILEDPTVKHLAGNDPLAPSDVANLLVADGSYWRQEFDHVMTRLSLRLRWWQLGNDLDTSFYRYPDLPAKLLSIRQQLFRFGQDVKLGIGWRWPQQDQLDPWQPPVAAPTWDFEQMSATPPLTAEHFFQVLSATPRTPARRWVLINPATSEPEQSATSSATSAEHDFRVREFVQQMVAAKIHGANGIFIANPFTGPAGVLHIDGTPGELLLPWRTTSCLLGGTHYLGGLQLPNGSTNYLFERADGEVVMLVWNDRETVEELYLGESVELVDVWGRRKLLAPAADGQVAVQVGPQPRFVLGLHPGVARWRMAVAFDEERLPSVFSRPHDNRVRGVNSFGQGVAGKYSLFVPAANDHLSHRRARNERWAILPQQGELAVAAQQSFELPIQILLDEADYGPQPIRIDFDVEADRRYQFSVWRTVQVGLGDIEIATRSFIDDRGQLVVEQQMTNSGPRLADFKCLLYAPPRRRKRTQVVMLGPEGNQKSYYYSEGEELLGSELKLRAEEMSGSRVLIHRFTAERGE